MILDIIRCLLTKPNFSFYTIISINKKCLTTCSNLHPKKLDYIFKFTPQKLIKTFYIKFQCNQTILSSTCKISITSMADFNYRIKASLTNSSLNKYILVISMIKTIFDSNFSKTIFQKQFLIQILIKKN